jgi:hypothetical protein
MIPRVWPMSLLAAALVLAACDSSPVTYSPAPPTTTPESSPLPTRDNYLNDITCSSAMDCIAVGHVAPGISEVGPENRTLIEENTGSGWNIVPSPNAPAPAVGSSLSGITCISQRNCIAVGESQDKASGPKTLIEQNTGSGWTIVPSPNAAAYGGDGSLDGVSCDSPSHCVAVGSYESEGNFQTLIEENAGHGWQVVASPNARPSDDEQLKAVACPNRTLCIAVGSIGLGPELPLVEQNSGSGWTLVSVPGAGGLAGIACADMATCVATGGEFSLSGSTFTIAPLIEEMTNGRWRTATVPMKAGVLAGVACRTPTSCISVSAAPLDSILVHTSVTSVEESGDTWVMTTTSGLESMIDRLTGVACSDATRCFAVGDQFFGGTDPLPYPKPRGTLIAQYTSQGWAIQGSPNI